MLVIFFLFVANVSFTSDFSITDLLENSYIQNVAVITNDIMPNIFIPILKKDFNRTLYNNAIWLNVGVFCALREMSKAWQKQIEACIDIVPYIVALSYRLYFCRKSLLSLFFLNEFHEDVKCARTDVPSHGLMISLYRLSVKDDKNIVTKNNNIVGILPEHFFLPTIGSHTTRVVSRRVRNFFSRSPFLKNIIGKTYTQLFLDYCNQAPYDTSKDDYDKVEFNSFFGKLKFNCDYYYQKQDRLKSPYFQWKKGTIVVMKYDETSSIQFQYQYLVDIFSELDNGITEFNDDSVDQMLKCLYRHYQKNMQPMNIHVFIRNPGPNPLIKEQKNVTLIAK